MADRISKLPDEVLCHILSFLPTQNAIATSLVSKRWKTLWRSVSTLSFHDRTYLKNNINKSYDDFSKFIYRTILTRDLHHQPITSFRLHCRSSHFNLSDSDLNVWLNAVHRDGLENLHIVLPSALDTITSKISIFSCKTLVVLRLIALDVDAFSFVHLPSLKTLHLEEVHFPKPKFLMELLSGCTMLEYMHLRDITTVNYDGDSTSSYDKFNILTKLVEADISCIDSIIPLKVICNVEFLSIDEYRDDIPVFPNLTHLELMMSGIGMNWHLVLPMLKKCPKLQNLSVDMEGCYTDMVWISPFNDVECLSSQLQQCSITNYKGTKSELHFATCIMQSSKVLRTMTIDTEPSSEQGDKFEMIKKLSLCPRSSAICQLSFK